MSRQPRNSLLKLQRYEKTLCKYSIPKEVVATKASSSMKAWEYGEQRSLLHNCWLLRTDDPKMKRAKIITASFDIIIDVNGMLLSHPNAVEDNLTKKVVCLALFSTRLSSTRRSAESASVILRFFNWIVRWRRSLGLKRMSDLNACHFDQFIASLEIGGVLSLVPVQQRLARLTDSEFIERFTKSRLRGELLLILWDKLATALGVTEVALSNSKAFRESLLARFPLMLSRETKSQGSDGSAISGRSQENKFNLLLSWDLLYRLSKSGELAHDPLLFDPFLYRSLYALSEQNASEPGRTLTILPEDLFRLLDAAARWVLEHADHIVNAAKLLDESGLATRAAHRSHLDRFQLSESLDATLPESMPKLFLDWKAHQGNAGQPLAEGRLNLGEAISHLLTAASIIIGVFAARRVGELESLQSGCIIEDKPGLCELSVYIEKTLRDLDRIPVPILVKHVVTLLEALSETTRATTGNSWLFELHRPGRQKQRFAYSFDG